MGGVDIRDQKREYYGVGRSSKKWWKFIFHFIINVCVVNSFILYVLNNRPPLTAHGNRQLTLRNNLVQQLIGNTLRTNVQAGNEVCPSVLHPLNCFTLLSWYWVVLKCVLSEYKWKEKLLLEGKNKPLSNVSSVMYHSARRDAFWNIRSEMWRFKIRVSKNICFYMFQNDVAKRIIQLSLFFKFLY
jgi:hypothetical protein